MKKKKKGLTPKRAWYVGDIVMRLRQGKYFCKESMNEVLNRILELNA